MNVLKTLPVDSFPTRGFEYFREITRGETAGGFPSETHPTI